MDGTKNAVLGSTVFCLPNNDPAGHDCIYAGTKSDSLSVKPRSLYGRLREWSHWANILKKASNPV